MDDFCKIGSINSSLNPQILSYGKILVDTDSCRVKYDDTGVDLYPKEYDLLVLFLKYPNHVLSYEFIVDKIWDIDKYPTPGNIRTHIKGLRKAFKKVDESEEIIETVHGIGYRLKPVKTFRESKNSIISPSLSIMKGFFKAKAIEYLVIDNQWVIRYISPGLNDYCDYPEFLKVGIQAEEVFPEFIGLEEGFEKILNQELDKLEIKGIARSVNPNRPEFINFYVMSEECQNRENKTDKLLFIFFEDASEHMSYRQRLVQLENTMYLMLEVESHRLS